MINVNPLQEVEVLVVCDIRILISIQQWDKNQDFDSILINCVGILIAWAHDNCKYVSNTIYALKLLRRTK